MVGSAKALAAGDVLTVKIGALARSSATQLGYNDYLWTLLVIATSVLGGW